MDGDIIIRSVIVLSIRKMNESFFVFERFVDTF